MELNKIILTRKKQIDELKLKYSGKELWSCKNDSTSSEDKACIREIKGLIRDSLINEVKLCAYCKRVLVGEFRGVVDAEHILPKSIYPDLEFKSVNLTLACRRCNFIKSDSVGFIDEHLSKSLEEKLNYYSSDDPCVRRIVEATEFYEIIHPNIDNYWDYISVYRIQSNDLFFTKYTFVGYENWEGSIAQTKSVNTYNMFKLRQFELERLCVSLGIPEHYEYVPEFYELTGARELANAVNYLRYDFDLELNLKN